MATAAGVAGGALLFEGIRGMFGHNTAAAATPPAPLLPPEQLSAADLAQDEGAADDYDMTSDDSSFDRSDT